MRRRDFITGVAGSAAAWPLTVRGQPGEKMRHIGVLMPVAEADPVGQARLGAFLQGLRQLGWANGRNVRIDIRWGAGDLDLTRKYARELVAGGPGVIMVAGTDATAALWQVTRTVPIVFAPVADPVGAGYVASLARPGGNVTGFAGHEFALSGKWLELLKEIAPRVTRVAVARDSAGAAPAQFAAIQAVAPSLRVELLPFEMRNAGEIERTISAFAGNSNGGLIITGTAGAIVHHELIVALAARYRLPAVYYTRDFVTGGGLISYGADLTELCRRAATYVDRILKGATPADLPVQVPTKYELVINLKTAKALGLDVPPTLLARADEVIE